MSEPHLLIVASRRRGRPRCDEPRTTVSSRIKIATHDALIRIANERSVSVSKLISDVLTSATRTPRR